MYTLYILLITFYAFVIPSYKSSYIRGVREYLELNLCTHSVRYVLKFNRYTNRRNYQQSRVNRSVTMIDSWLGRAKLQNVIFGELVVHFHGCSRTTRTANPHSYFMDRTLSNPQSKQKEMVKKKKELSLHPECRCLHCLSRHIYYLNASIRSKPVTQSGYSC